MKKYGILIAVLLAALGARVYSQPDEMKPLHKVIAKLNLTDEQKKDVGKVGAETEKQVIAQRAKIATARVDLRQLFKADTPEQSAIEKKIGEIADLEVQLHKIRINSWFTINKMLTSDQQKIWKKALENAPAMRQQRMMNRMGKRPMMPQRHEPPMQK